MRSKDITLSASLMAIFIGLKVVGSISPTAMSTLATSALFGIFWPFFSNRLNLTFILFRTGFSLVDLVRSAPRIINIMRIQSVFGLGVLDWFYEVFGGTIDLTSLDLLTALGKLKMGPNFWIFMTGFILFFDTVLPYLFYRYFKAAGVFRRLPSF